jgi:hypothetical protein
MEIVHSTMEDLEGMSSIREKNGYVRDEAFYHYELDPGTK